VLHLDELGTLSKVECVLLILYIYICSLIWVLHLDELGTLSKVECVLLILYIYIYMFSYLGAPPG
jgi:hypothetical protein